MCKDDNIILELIFISLVLTVSKISLYLLNFARTNNVTVSLRTNCADTGKPRFVLASGCFTQKLYQFNTFILKLQF